MNITPVISPVLAQAEYLRQNGASGNPAQNCTLVQAGLFREWVSRAGLETGQLAINLRSPAGAAYGAGLVPVRQIPSEIIDPDYAYQYTLEVRLPLDISPGQNTAYANMNCGMWLARLTGANGESAAPFHILQTLVDEILRSEGQPDMGDSVTIRLLERNQPVFSSLNSYYAFRSPVA